MPDPFVLNPLPPAKHLRIDNSCELESEDIPHNFGDFDADLKDDMREIPTTELAKSYPGIVFTIIRTDGGKPLGHDFCVDRKGGRIWCVGDWRKKE